VYAPLTGEVVAINEDLSDEPELVNSDPYGEGWLFSLRVDDVDILDDLMDADAYVAASEEE
jgi:glycine cleavage system H protein